MFIWQTPCMPYTHQATHTLRPAFPCCCAGVPQDLAPYQRLVATQRKAASTWNIDCRLTLTRWQREQALPTLLTALQDDQIYAVPMAAADEPPEPAVPLVSKTQVLWILQLARMRTRRWALHCDGKHGLHKGKWVLITYGTHSVTLRTSAECKSHSEDIVHRFRPLLFMVSKGHEDADSLVFGLKALETVARRSPAIFACPCSCLCPCPCPPHVPICLHVNHHADTPSCCRYHIEMVGREPHSLHVQKLQHPNPSLVADNQAQQPTCARKVTGTGGFLVSHYAGVTREGHGSGNKKRRAGPLCAQFGEQLKEDVRSLAAGSGWPMSFTEHMVEAAVLYNQQAEKSEPQLMFPQLIIPGAVISDGSKGIKAAFKHWWPKVPQYGDYAHIYFLFAEGRFLEKSHPRFEHVQTEVIPQMHTCQTRGAWNVLSEQLARDWRSDPALMQCHHRLFARDHANPWYIGIAEVGGAMPSQNAQEVCSEPCQPGSTLCTHCTLLSLTCPSV